MATWVIWYWWSACLVDFRFGDVWRPNVGGHDSKCVHDEVGLHDIGMCIVIQVKGWGPSSNIEMAFVHANQQNSFTL